MRNDGRSFQSGSEGPGGGAADGSRDRDRSGRDDRDAAGSSGNRVRTAESHSRAFPVSIATERFTLEGKSRAGNETFFRVRELGLSLDIGRCPDILVGLPHVFVTHAHLDHALGIPFYAAQRGLQRLPPGTVYIPAETVDDFGQLMKLHEKLEGTTYELNLHGMAPGDRVKLRRDLVAIAHRATHRVPANAYEFVELRHKLKPEFASFADEELAELRRGHVSLVDESEHPILFYTGDTDRGILEATPAMFRAEVLVIECSFTLAEHRDRAERYRHIHVEDLYDFADRFENRLIVLSHFSLRYSPAEIQRYLSKSCPAILRDRIRLALADPYSHLE